MKEIPSTISGYIADDLSRATFMSDDPLAPDDPFARGTNDTDVYAFAPNDARTAPFEWVSRTPAASHVTERPAIEQTNSPDAKHSVYSASVIPGDPFQLQLYMNDRTGAAGELVSQLPDGTQSSSAPTALAVSNDGSNVLFRVDGVAYVRLRNDSRTLRLGSVPQGAPTLSRDGSTVTIETPDPLTADDTDSSIDVFSVTLPSGVARRITAPADGVPGVGTGNTDACASSYGAAQCDASFVATNDSNDVSYVLSPEVLASGPAPGPVTGAANLYVSRGGELAFVGTVTDVDAAAPGENNTGSSGDPSLGALRTPFQSLRGVRVSTAGVLVFQSRARLTDFDNGGVRELYRYDPATGSMSCASCAAFGANRDSGWKELGFGPALANNSMAVSGRGLTADGSRVFFETPERLVTSDTNNRMDVYEYDSSTGQKALISSGTSVDPTYYVDSSSDGRDVFIQTTDSFVPDDRNGTTYKVYDAREGGGFPVPPTPSACRGEACRGFPAAPPVLSLPSSDQPAAPGNFPIKPRVRLFIRRPTSSAVRRAARSGRLTITVRASVAARVRLGATVSGRSKAGGGSVTRRVRKNVRTNLVLRFGRTAVRGFQSRRFTQVNLKLSAAQARDQTLTLKLR